MILLLLQRLRNKTAFNRKTSFSVDILLFDSVAVPLTLAFAKIPFVTPNLVTIFSGCFGILASGFFYSERLVTGSILMYFSMMLDCVDGNLARKTGATSAFGAKLDQWADSLKKVLCLGALTFVSQWNVWLVSALVILHYSLLRLFPQRYPEKYLEKHFTALGLEPLFAPYDLLVCLLFLGPLLSFEIVLVSVIVVQLLTSTFAATRLAPRKFNNALVKKSNQ
jgi:phosphatidylglycerophosphate synthase